MSEKQRKRRRRAILIALAALLAAGSCVVLFRISDSAPTVNTILDWLWPNSAEDFDGRRGTLCKQRMRAFAVALALYVSCEGSYPYSQSGESYALDLLAPHLDEARTLIGVTQDNDGTNILFSYINKPNAVPNALNARTIILAESRPDEQGGRWCVRNDGAIQYVETRAVSIVGHEY